MTKEYSTRVPRLISDIRIAISSWLQKELNQSDCKKMVPSHGEIIFNLITNDEMTMTELSSSISKDRSTVTALVAKLIKQGVVEYTDNPEDGRSKKVRLTQKGKELQKDFLNISTKMNEILWNNISQEEKDLFIKVLLKIKNNFTTM